MKRVSKDKSPQTCGEGKGWDYAIRVAEAKIGQSEDRIQRLRAAIRTFQEMKERGEPWVEAPTSDVATL